MADRYYIYLHVKLCSGEPFYIGKGTLARAYRKVGRSLFWNKIANKHGFDVFILENNLTEQESFEREHYWINRIGRRDLNKGTLVNLTNGGEGASGCVQSEESKNKKSLSLKGIKRGSHSIERIKNMSKPRSDKAKLNIKLGNLAKTNSAYNKGKTRFDIEEIKKLINEGKSQSYIASLFNTHQGTISDVIKKHITKGGNFG